MTKEPPQAQPTPAEPGEETGETATTPPAESALFPWLAFFAAALFDIIGMIPIVNFLSEPIAKLSFGLWQKVYAPKTDPVMTAILTLIADGIFLGFLPSNIATVVYAYIKKRAAAKVKIPSVSPQKLTQQPA